MQKSLIFLSLIFCSLFSYAQNVGIGTNVPHASAALEIKDSTKGILIPRMTMVQRNAIANPAEGLMVYQTDSMKGFWYWDGLIWQNVKSNMSNDNSNNGINMLVFTPGICSWIVPNGIKSVIVEMWGGGGGGGEASQAGATQYPARAGGGGAYGKSSVGVIPGSSCTIEVGYGGNGGLPNGINGGNTIFNGIIQASGGIGGGSVNVEAPGGTSNADINITGGSGSYGTCQGGGAGGTTGGPNYGFGRGGNTGCRNYSPGGGSGSNGCLILYY